MIPPTLLPAALSFLRRYWRIAAVVAVVLVGWWQLHAFGERHERIGGARIQALWDADELAEKAVADAATLAAQLQDAADAARNQRIADDHAKELAAATADRDRYLGLLQRARAAASTVRTGEAANLTGASEASTPRGSAETGALAEHLAAIDRATADVMVEARQNADQLDALQSQLVPQM